MEDLILLDSIVRDSGAVTRANGGLLPPGVSCGAHVNRELSFAGTRIGLPMGFWASLDPSVSLSPKPMSRTRLTGSCALQVQHDVLLRGLGHSPFVHGRGWPAKTFRAACSFAGMHTADPEVQTKY